MHTTQVAEARQALSLLKANMRVAVKGKDDVIEHTLVCFAAGGHLLIEDRPGLGKTTLAYALARSMDCSFSRIQFTSDLLPSDVTGVAIYDEHVKEFVFKPGPIFANIVLADEINRATPKTQSALLEAMQERSVTAGRQTHTLAAPFFVLATQNPLEMEGTYPLPEAQLDRFFFKLDVPFPSAAELHEIVARTVRPGEVTLSQVLTGEDILQIREFALGCPVAHHVVDYAVQLVSGSHGALTAARKHVRSGGSPRAVQALILGAKLRALSQGRANGATDDIRALAKPVLRHRILLNFDAEADGVRPDQIIDQMLAELDHKLGKA